MNVVARWTARRTFVVWIVLVLGVLHRVSTESDELDNVRSCVGDSSELKSRDQRKDSKHRQQEMECASPVLPPGLNPMGVCPVAPHVSSPRLLDAPHA